MRKIDSILLTAMLVVATGYYAAWATQRPQVPGTFPAINLSGEGAVLPVRSGQVDLCALATDDGPIRETGPNRTVLRRLPSIEVETERSSNAVPSSGRVPAAFPSPKTELAVSPIVPEREEPKQALLLTNPTVTNVALPAPPAAPKRTADGPTLTPLDKAQLKLQSEKPFMGIQNFDRSMEVDADWVEKTAQEPPIDPQTLLSARLPNEVVAQTKSMLAAASTLANRGAQFAARKQFEKIMRVTCQALDAQVGRSAHSLALARGLRAIEEAEDFGLNGESAESDLKLGGFIAGHDTPVLKETPPAQVTALLAMQAYYRYAIEQLSIAGNNESISSEILFSLGRIEALLSLKTGDIAGGGPKALAFYHAALAVDPNNGRAANELGVMLARRGRLQEARNMFVQAVSSQPTAVLNLSKVYRQLGDVHRAQQCTRQAQMIVAKNPAAFSRGPESGVRWVDHTTFIRDGAGSDVSPAATPIRRASSDASLTKPTGQAASAVFDASRANQTTTKTKSKLRFPFGWKK